MFDKLKKLLMTKKIQVDDTLKVKYTKKPSLRGTMPDGQKNNQVFIFKFSSTLNLTYQIKLLAFMCHEKNFTLVISVNKNCVIKPKLNEFLSKFADFVELERKKD